MPETAAQLLATFDSLPPNEKHDVLIEMLRRNGELHETILTDDHFVELADNLFQILDAEESNGRESDSK